MGDDIAHGIGKVKAATFAAVPDVIEKGKQIDYQANWKNRGKDSYVFAGKVSVGGRPAYLAAVVLRGDDNKFYLHEVVDEKGNFIYINKKDASAGVQDRTNRGSGDTGAGAASFTGAYQVSDAGAPDLTAKTELELTPNSSIRESGAGVKPDPVELPSVDTGKSGEGLPMKRREEIQDALTAGLNGGRTLGDNEARTGLPLPTEVESQLQNASF